MIVPSIEQANLSSATRKNQRVYTTYTPKNAKMVAISEIQLPYKEINPPRVFQDFFFAFFSGQIQINPPRNQAKLHQLIQFQLPKSSILIGNSQFSPKKPSSLGEKCPYFWFNTQINPPREGGFAHRGSQLNSQPFG